MLGLVVNVSTGGSPSGVVADVCEDPLKYILCNPSPKLLTNL
jgi:hypothetical protein